MKRALLEELANVAYFDAEALRDPYAWPPKMMTDDERREADRLLVLSRRIAYRAIAEGE